MVKYIKKDIRKYTHYTVAITGLNGMINMKVISRIYK